MRRTRSIWPIAAGVVALGGLSALGINTFGQRAKSTAQVAPTPPQTVVDTQTAFENVAQTVRPAIVSITSRMTIKQAAFDSSDGSSPGDLGDLFGGQGGPGGPGIQMPRGMQMQPRPRTAVGTGSGFIVRKDGYILTNDHVVGGADSVTVKLDDGREFTGKVSRDQRSDLAIVKINADNLPTLQLADSKNVKIGQWAIAFGSPFGLQDTMTVGVVSALGRETAIGDRNDERFYPNLIQTDASINPGNSGGALVDIYGRVIGVNVAIGSPNGGNVGIGFAIPANSAGYIMDQLISKGSVVRGYLGFAPENLGAGDSTRYGVNHGALVAMVEENSPAAKAGLQVEDVVTSFNSQPIDKAADLRDAVSRVAPGRSVPLTVRRGGKDVNLNGTVESAPGAKIAAEAAPAAPAQGKLGIQVGALTPEIAKQFGIDENTKGVVVASVAPGSPASEAGLKAGDILVRVNNQAINAPGDVASSIKSLNSSDVAPIVVKRGNSRVLVRAQLR
jgi:serine protease Do